MKTQESLSQVSAKNELTREEIFTFFKSLKQELDALKDRYDKLYNGAMGGIVIIIATIGLNIDTILKLIWYEKILLGIILLLLLLSAGNILNCITFDTNTRLSLLLKERELILKDYESLPCKDINDIEVNFISERNRNNQFYTNSFAFLLFAILLGVIGFFIILAR